MMYFRKLLLAVTLLPLAWPAASAPAADNVLITDQGTHYEVVIDVTDGTALVEAADEYIAELKALVPDYEQIADSYLNYFLGDIAGDVLPPFLPDSYAYDLALNRTGDVITQVPDEWRSLIERAASGFSGGTTNVLGDGRLSRDEAYMLNLITDVLRPSACSANAVYGDRSATGSTIATRNLEWIKGDQNQILRIQAVTTIKKADRSVMLIGFLGHFGGLSMYSDKGVFAAILDSATGANYSSTGKRSYVFDLVEAMLNNDTLDEVAEHMINPANQYTFNHLIFLADPTTAKVVENNISGIGSNVRRAVRQAGSALNPGVSWNLADSVCTVNSFMLAGNTDNYSADPSDVSRWGDYTDLMTQAGDVVDAEQMKRAACWFNGAAPDWLDIYNTEAIQIMVVQPATNDIAVYFRPSDGSLPTEPIFEPITVDFGS